MNTTKRAIAATQGLLIFPAILFMGALIVRQLSPLRVLTLRVINTTCR